MLLIFITIYLLSKNSSAAPLSYPTTLDARTPTDSSDNINNNNVRQFSDMVWGCLATIFACTWVSVHPNVPPPDQNSFRILWRRLKMMLIAIIAPEITVGFAARQFFASWRLSKQFKFSRTHAFFFCMGGFVSSAGYPIAIKKQLEDPGLGLEFQEAIRAVNEEDILDRSKGDALSKGAALLQGLWFVMQCLARVHQRLTVTELEVATLAFAIVNIFIWLLWWNKPLDVHRPIIVGPCTLPGSHSRISESIRHSHLDRFLEAIFGVTVDGYDPLSSDSVSSFWSLSLDTDSHRIGALCITMLIGGMFGAVHCTAWNALFPTVAEMWTWRYSSLVVTALPGVALEMLPVFAMRESSLDGTILSLNPVLVAVMIWIGIFTYVAARLILIVLPFTCLRSLPPSAFVDVNWSMYIPHT
ncbi:hypothetical protein MSAN_00822800 [Mycena sanguinolenta]|uniref:Uncharacterized protein n=1 Tax=Mycena sanguinolenta TaxID=230812 RepID=A0A8H6Z1G4_9AGAR|nr:hypothetical protein MSAN_00822800 [Mycena sanguinolenta]